MKKLFNFRLVLNIICLWIFVSVQIINILCLSVDLGLELNALPTITSFAKKNLWFAISVMVFESLGVSCLGVHLFSDE